MEAEKTQSKRGGESIDDQRDRISELPDALILQILSLLPTKSAIATSVLSKPWQFHWKMLPKLKFDHCDHITERGTLSKNVCKVLLSHKAPVLESLHIDIRSGTCYNTDIETWGEIANSRLVRNLAIHVETWKSFYTFPKSLYNSETLETLTLKGFVFEEDVAVPSSQVCLKSLKTLHIQSAFFRGEEFVKLLSGCANLENLLLDLCGYLCKVKTFAIAVPSLQRLSIYDSYDSGRDCGYVIDAPSLKYLKIEGEHGLKFRLTENVTKLEEAYIVDVSYHTINENLLESLTSVKRLSLELVPLKEVKFPTDSIFYQLVSLEIYTSTNAWWDLLTFMLDSSPILQVLKLINTQKRGGWRQGFVAGRKWKQPENVPECLLFHLETFMWTGSDEGLVEEEKEVAKYILKNTNLLERASFSSIRMSSEDRLELECVVRASNSCQILFE
ncbi:unnamed protein product [Microthlaspi erraticum]|uniref:FBD domain-containing protein n=1 Tax=Microthlaspi erraticum TaxID=1685480 RepID=A0A6D2JVV2_9BRAS|nr:unnamed protein product [Microthlaspi erraticum]CAA7055000.1 unnamed protein product [Microthlaspi erraticum]